jgi:hypothetical protein
VLLRIGVEGGRQVTLLRWTDDGWPYPDRDVYFDSAARGRLSKPTCDELFGAMVQDAARRMTYERWAALEARNPTLAARLHDATASKP